VGVRENRGDIGQSSLMLTKPERKELYDWISEAVKCQKGLASDFKDGMALLDILMHYHPRFFHKTLVERSSAPSKCKQNWESLRKNELSILGVKIPENGYQDELMPYYIGKSDENNRPYIEELLWEIKKAVDDFVPPKVSAPSLRRRSIGTARSRSQRKITSYLDELNDDDESRRVVLPDIHQKSEHRKSVATIKPRGKSAFKREALPPIHKKPAKSYDPEESSPGKKFLDKLDGEEDGDVFGIKLKGSNQEIAKLQQRLREMEGIVQKQEQEIKRLRAASAKAKDPNNVVNDPEGDSKETAKAKPNVKLGNGEILVRSITYLEDQTEEMKGKSWVNVGTSDGKTTSISYDEKTMDVKITPGARRFTDSIETQEFDVEKMPLKWYLTFI
jgi:hypothetical protein